MPATGIVLGSLAGLGLLTVIGISSNNTNAAWQDVINQIQDACDQDQAKLDKLNNSSISVELNQAPPPIY